jgi:group I intron endonuclease
VNASGIYGIHCKVSGRWYVGSASSICSRWKSHRSMLKHGKHHSPSLQRSWNKHGAQEFEFVILERIEDVDTMLLREQGWIDKLHASDSHLGFNIAPVAGTRRGVPQPQSVADKMRAFHLGKPKSAETRVKMSESSKGKVKSPEHRQRIAESVRILMSDPKNRERIAEKLRGVALSDERKANISMSMMGRKPSQKAIDALIQRNRTRSWSAEDRAKAAVSKFGKKASDEARAKMSSARKGKPHPWMRRPRSEAWCLDHSAKLRANWAKRKAAALQPQIST